MKYAPYIVTTFLVPLLLSAQAPVVQTLTQHIAHADAVSFKKEYAQRTISSEDHTSLITAAHLQLDHVKKQLDGINQLEKNFIHTSSIKKAILTLSIGLYCAIQTAYVAYSALMPLSFQECEDTQEKKVNHEFFLTFPRHVLKVGSTKGERFFIFLWPPLSFYHQLHHYTEKGNGKYVTATIAPLLCAVGSYLAYKGLHAGVKNLKIAFNYKQYLEEQQANLDEIILLLTNDSHTKDIK